MIGFDSKNRSFVHYNQILKEFLYEIQYTRIFKNMELKIISQERP